jgi:hypothetical protein
MDPIMTLSDFSPVPLDEWMADMLAAVDDIRVLGLEILRVHGQAGEMAQEVSREWHLEERQRAEHQALVSLFSAAEEIIGSLDTAMQNLDTKSLLAAVAVIDRQLPGIETSFLTARHAAQDLLRWTLRAGQIEGSTLPDDYRAAYARLISYTPRFKPRLEAMQQKLLKLATSPGVGEGIRELLSAITRYNGVLDSARSFVQTIVDPPLELVFQETQLFVEDRHLLSAEARAHCASELNDCCQLLLYDEAAFERRTEAIRPQLAEGMEASLFSLSVDALYLLFTVDEDPVFGQLTVTLLRAVTADDYSIACESIIQTLYSDMTGGDSDG